MLIDAHAHLLPDDYPADAPACFPRMEPVDGDTARVLVFGPTRFTARDVFFDAERRIAAMDAAGVDAEVLTPMPSLLRYDLPPADGLALARHVNEFTAALCSAAPTRLFGFGMVPMQEPELAAAEVAAIRDLGLYGVEIASSVAGVPIGEERFRAVFTEAQRLGVAVFVHALPGPVDRLPAAAKGTYAVGLEGARAAASLVTGGTAASCPDLRISFSHAAGGFPLMLPRAQYFQTGAWNEEPALPHRAPRPDDGPAPLEYARRFYYDSLVFDRRAVRYLIDLLGHDRLLVGSDFPAMAREEPTAATLRSMDLDPAVLADITWYNAFRFLGIEPPG
ncbi:amidohydrolase family protein [Solwaraspora sp. WMMB335]|uniref:amidohydrolase family protein n=1 Tax=Solwaraspora sp. WMMB335 TaxID=3404118 RepID=UPI003B961B0D